MTSPLVDTPATDHTTDPRDLLPDLPPGLTSLDVTRIAGAAAAAQAPATQRIYRHAWGAWVRWCRHRGIVALPADPAAICAYLVERVDAGLAVVSLGPIGCAIGHVHRLHGFPNPMEDPAVRQVRAGLRRLHGTAARRQARPLSVPELRQILAAIDRNTRYGARDAAIILLGYASALRSSELAALTLADLDTKPGGLLVKIRKSKTDQDGAGQVVGVAHGDHPDTDPISAVHHWLRHRAARDDIHDPRHDVTQCGGIYGPPGPLFVRMRGGIVSDHPLAPHTISRLLTARAEAAGLPAARITSHSLRAGHATTAFIAGVHVDRIAAQTRHKDVSVLLNRYIRPLDAMETTTSRDLGL